ncbi:MAG: FRG domain-containing protein [Planctomycetota bacterium]
MRREFRIASIVAFIEHIEEKCDKDYVLFRGQPQQKKKRPLLPLIGRPNFAARQNLIQDERQMLEEFMAQSVPLLSFRPASPLEWLAVAQHHGMSTRLLDWTTNPLAALWFAIRSGAQKRKDAEVHYFESEDRDWVSAEAKASPLTVSRCLVYRPPHISARIVRQSGWFTLHPLDAGGAFVSLNEDPAFTDRLRCLRVPKTAFPKMRYALDRYGAHEAAFMPDLPGTAAYVDWCHRLLDDEKAGGKRRRRTSADRKAGTSTTARRIARGRSPAQ